MSTTAAERSAWTAQGSQDAAQRTYESVKTALARSSELAALDYEVFLQGSYANHTNTRGDSDVDIVVMLKTSFTYNTDAMSEQEATRYRAQVLPATVTFTPFRQVVKNALDIYYGSDRVESKDKCLRVHKREGYVDADVVPSFQYRKYLSFPLYGEPRFVEGTELRPLSGGSIVNYPKEHRKNGANKNAGCDQRFKPTVRQVKRLRRKAVDLGRLSKDDAPGYLLECMVYNVSDITFVNWDDSARLVRVLAELNNQSAEDYRRLHWSCDHIHHLFQDDPGKHNEYTARRVVDVLWDLL